MCVYICVVSVCVHVHVCVCESVYVCVSACACMHVDRGEGVAKWVFLSLKIFTPDEVSV